jgi:hypothetical protein
MLDERAALPWLPLRTDRHGKPCTHDDLCVRYRKSAKKAYQSGLYKNSISKLYDMLLDHGFHRTICLFHALLIMIHHLYHPPYEAHID